MNDKIRFFKTNKMKAYDSVDIDLSSIISRSKDLRVADTYEDILLIRLSLRMVQLDMFGLKIKNSMNPNKLRKV